MRLNDLEDGHVETDIMTLDECFSLRGRYRGYLLQEPTSDPRRGFVLDWLEDLEGVIEQKREEASDGH